MADLGARANIYIKSGTQDLSVGSLSLSTSIAHDFRLDKITIAGSATWSQLITIIINSNVGPNYDVVIGKCTTASATDVIWTPNHGDEFLLVAGDEIDLTIENSGTPSVNLYAVIYAEFR